jgi:hypothetical protein
MPNLLKTKTVFEFATDLSAREQLKQIFADHQLPTELTTEVQKLLFTVLDGSVPPASMPAALMTIFTLTEDRAKHLAADLAGYRLLPLQLYIGGIKNRIVEWGGDPAKYPSVIIEKEKIHPEDVILDLVKKIGLELPEPMMKRFIYLGRGFLTGERDREATMVLFKRSVNIGGLELTDEQTLKCLELLSAEKSKLEVIEMEMGTEVAVGADPGIGPVTNSPMTDQAPKSKSPKPLMLPKEQVEAMLKAPDFEEATLSAAARVTATTTASGVLPRPTPVFSSPASSTAGGPPGRVTPSAVPTAKTAPAIRPVVALTKEVPVIAGELIADHEKKDVEVAAKKIVKQQIASPEDKKKTEAAVNAALAPVIAAFKAKNYSKQDFSDLAQAHVKGVREAHQTERLLLDKFKFDQKEVDSLMAALEAARKAADSAVGSVSKPMPGSAPNATATSEIAALDLKHAALTGKMPSEPIEPLMPTSRVSAARSKTEEVALQTAKIDDTKIKDALTASRPEKAKAMLTVVSAPPVMQPGATITDVKFAPHLTGPVEELGTMTPEQFRRLSSDPMEAVAKISDKLTLLQNLSYADRVRGVEAWRQSPVSQLYLVMTAEALQQGVAIAEISTRRRNAGQDSLSPAEIKAVMELNKRIKF